MAVSLDNKLVVAISSRALFNFEEENALFESGDARAYMKLQLERLDVPARPGIAFSLVKKLLAFNDATAQRVEVVILSRNDPVSGMRIFRSGHANELKLERGVFTAGPLAVPLPAAAARPPVPFGQCRRRARGAGGRLSGRAVLTESVLAGEQLPQRGAHRLRRRRGAVLRRSRARVPGAGAATPSSSTSRARPRSRCPTAPSSRCWRRCTGCSRPARPAMRIRTALVTARSAPAHERAIRTLMNWDIQVDEAMFLGGLPKGEFLREFEPDFFFDDQTGHVDHAARHVPSGHVASGISNPSAEPAGPRYDGPSEGTVRMNTLDKLAAASATMRKVWALAPPYFQSEEKWKARAPAGGHRAAQPRPPCTCWC